MAHTNVQLVSGNLTTGQASPTFFIDRVNDKIGIGGVPDITGDTSSNVLQVSGNMFATRYHGDGSNLTGLNDSKWLEYSGDASKIYYNGGNVGIGVDNPGSKLDVNGTVTATSFSGSAASLNSFPTLNQDTTGTATNQSGGTVSATTIDASGIITCNANKIVITGDAPTLYLRDSDERTGMIHMNSNRMYFLSGAANSDTWTQINGQWPLYLQTDTNAAVFGGTVTAPTFSGALSGNATTATSAGSVTNGVYTTGTQSIAGTKTFTSEAKFCVSGHTSHIGYSTNRDWYIRSGLSAGQVILQDTGGYVGIGTSSPAYTLDVTGDIYATGDVTASSDRRLKTDIKRIENALDKVCSLGGYTYVMNDKPSSGLIAQEVLEVLPEVVHGSEETNYSLAYGNIVGLLVEAIKELKEKVG
jgi:hypothetical protein